MTALQSTLQSQFAEWACKEQSLWSRPVVITIQEQHSLGRDRHGCPHQCSLVLPGDRRCPCSKWGHFFIFAYIYPCAMRNDSREIDNWSSCETQRGGARGRRRRGKDGQREKGTPLRGGSFYHPPLDSALTFSFFWPEKVKVRFACFVIYYDFL